MGAYRLLDAISEKFSNSRRLMPVSYSGGGSNIAQGPNLPILHKAKIGSSVIESQLNTRYCSPVRGDSHLSFFAFMPLQVAAHQSAHSTAQHSTRLAMHTKEAYDKACHAHKKHSTRLAMHTRSIRQGLPCTQEAFDKACHAHKRSIRQGMPCTQKKQPTRLAMHTRSIRQGLPCTQKKHTTRLATHSTRLAVHFSTPVQARFLPHLRMHVSSHSCACTSVAPALARYSWSERTTAHDRASHTSQQLSFSSHLRMHVRGPSPGEVQQVRAHSIEELGAHVFEEGP
jgi:hypothetical protein